MITASSNSRVRFVQQLQKKAKLRKAEGLFLVEGPKMYGELPLEWVREVYVSEQFFRDGQNRALLERHACEVVKDSVFETMCDTKTPQGILALARQPVYRWEDFFPSGRPALLLVLDTIQDPGNLGTMMRAGEGAGITGILMTRDTVDIYNPKTVRATMGSLFRIPFLYTDDIVSDLKRLKQQGVSLYGAHLKGALPYDAVSYRQSCAFLIGNEANGLSDETAGQADICIQIPMAGKVESLNAAIASSVLLYEAARQRRQTVDR